ncbi:hypothetical protein J2W22_001766 [Sphingomonas kyeonggiensis]|uniref:hypothetical protein n=1 Tax=Sphingomonas kyeonggiensis TaxID=1268553 RepID=UPI00278A8B40|nr:hypothetical protein [Sphingomonas kyeonggiensis]MDQ0249719.1 hypothetical protein [Sphingomonas kyeonggiensis]
MGSFRQWATMIRHVHKTHTETGIEEDNMGEELLALDAPKAPRERAEHDKPASGCETCPL